MIVFDDIEPAPARELDKDWWRGAVIYQIYPRSFQDSNGDGVGDLNGITQRLSYVAELGVDAIWISPFFTSPMADFGYDVSNYRDVDPIFGSLADFDLLIEKAHRLGLKVVIDLVLSHTSDQHPWFMESRLDRTNHRADWYVWADSKPDGSPPNNWLSIFGGSAWEWEPMRQQYYLHNFLTSQPDLNFHNAEVQEALLDEVRFWLDRGVDGFRLDTVNFYFHNESLMDNPAKQDRSSKIAPSVNPYTFQHHHYDKSQPENLLFLERLRALLDEYGAITTLGEVGDDDLSYELMRDYTTGDHRLHMCYTFDFLSGSFTPSYFADHILEYQERVPDGWPCWAFSNHDVTRHMTRWSPPLDLQDEFAKLAATVLLCLRGSVCLYQGEELGLGEADISFEDLVDPYGIRFWPRFKGRDGCRTPMVWTPDGMHGGFSEEKPWLPVSFDHIPRAVMAQSGRDGSVLDHYRRVLRLRRSHRVLAQGDILDVKAENGVLRFRRRLGNVEVFCAFNMTAGPTSIDGPGEGDWVPLSGATRHARAEGDRVHFDPYGGFLARTFLQVKD